MTEIAPATPIEAANAASCAEQQVLVRQILERVADKWTLLVIDALEQGEMRFSRLREKVGEVSQKMLTKTLRQLERDGLVTRRVYAEVPPRVDYRLTPLGHSLAESLCGVWQWAEANMEAVERSRQAFDTAKVRPLRPPA